MHKGQRCLVTFRCDEECEVEIDHDGGYEPDTGAHEFEWHFVGMTEEDERVLQITQAERDEITQQLLERNDDDPSYEDF